MNYDIEYWKVYQLKETRQSSFAEFCLPKMNAGESLLDMCCGNCRDADFFLSNNLKVKAFDIGDINRPYYEKIDLTQKSLSYVNFHHVFCRFVLHAVPEYLEDRILVGAYKALLLNGYLYIEARSDKGTEDGKHYRRLINIEKLKTKLKNIGFDIIYENEDTGLSVDYDDPVLIRIIAKKV